MAGANLFDLLPAIAKNICELRYPGKHAAKHLQFKAEPIRLIRPKLLNHEGLLSQQNHVGV